ncbi:MAG: 2-oxoacid:acceptor oxidoreductase family protein [Patescibacteria group bacterium]|jgi:2-oxoglutarate ferredoxin oxidoreductase subunit alpha
MNRLSIGIGGQAGEGVETLGHAIANLMAKMGKEIATNGEFYNAIKGSHNTFEISVSDEAALSTSTHYNLVIAMDGQTLAEEARRIVTDGYLIYDPETGAPDVSAKLVAVPFLNIAQEVAGTKLAKNMVLFGCFAAMVKAPKELLASMIDELLKNLPPEVKQRNVEAAQRGYEVASEQVHESFMQVSVKDSAVENYLMSGNSIAALAAVRAGCTFFAAYPMTPSTSILEFLAKWSNETKMSVHHVEDELAAINMAVGASYAGARAMVATSGGGFALMTEGVGLAAMLETPIVVVEVQRPGPATGLPTRTGQGDLRQVLHAGQGDVPHMVLSPGTHEEAFQMVREAFEYAEAIRGPVTVLMEKCLAEGMRTISVDALNQELDFTCERQLSNGLKRAISYEHDAEGNPTEDPQIVTDRQKSRWDKIAAIAEKLPPARLEGAEGAAVTLVCWGATYGAAMEASKLLTAEGIATNVLHVKYFRPFQPGVLEEFKKCAHPILIEGNLTAQLGGLITEKTGFEIKDKILDVSGRQFTAEGLVERIKEIL